jgi:hypothetical protein
MINLPPLNAYGLHGRTGADFEDAKTSPLKCAGRGVIFPDQVIWREFFSQNSIF